MQKVKKSKQGSGAKPPRGERDGRAAFRKLALSFAGAVEMEHMNHPDFRVNGKIFATLAYPGDEMGMVKLTPEAQAEFMRMEPKAFVPCNGAWGKNGCTNVRLEVVTEKTLRRALEAAWERLSGRS